MNSSVVFLLPWQRLWKNFSNLDWRCTVSTQRRNSDHSTPRCSTELLTELSNMACLFFIHFLWACHPWWEVCQTCTLFQTEKYSSNSGVIWGKMSLHGLPGPLESLCVCMWYLCDIMLIWEYALEKFFDLTDASYCMKLFLIFTNTETV